MATKKSIYRWTEGDRSERQGRRKCSTSMSDAALCCAALCRAALRCMHTAHTSDTVVTVLLWIHTALTSDSQSRFRYKSRDPAHHIISYRRFLCIKVTHLAWRLLFQHHSSPVLVRFVARFRTECCEDSHLQLRIANWQMLTRIQTSPA